MSAVEVITRAEYREKIPLGHAGTILTLGNETVTQWKTDHPEWTGKYWYLRQGETGKTLVPVNVVDSPAVSR